MEKPDHKLVWHGRGIGGEAVGDTVLPAPGEKDQPHHIWPLIAYLLAREPSKDCDVLRTLAVFAAYIAVM